MFKAHEIFTVRDRSKKIMMLWRKKCLEIRNNERSVRKGVSFIQKSATSAGDLLAVRILGVPF